MKVWRRGSNVSLFARPIYRDDLPVLINAMIEDGLVGTIGDRGVVWQNNGYSITPKSVRDAWVLTATQYKRICEHIYETDPFYTV